MNNDENYLRKYDPPYRTKRNLDKCYEIVCSRGTICVNSFVTPVTLLKYFEGGKTSRAKNYLKKQLEESGLPYRIEVEADFELEIVFKEDDLSNFEKIFQIKKRKQFSPEVLEKLRKNVRKAQEKKKRTL